MRLSLVLRREAPWRRGRRSISIGLKVNAIPLHTGNLHLIPQSRLRVAERRRWGASGSRPMELWPETFLGLLRRRSRVGACGVFLGHVALYAKPDLV